MPQNVTFRPSEALFHFRKRGLDFTWRAVVSLSVHMKSISILQLSRKRRIGAILGVECQFLSGRKPSVTETLNHYSLIELELYYFSWLFAGTTESLLINVGMSARESELARERVGVRQGERKREWGHEIPRGLSIPELGALMNEQNSPVTLELERTRNNSPFPYEERGAGGLQFASPLPQSLAFSRAFLIQRKHPRQNKTSAICSISPCFPPQSRWLSTGACSASAAHWSISASN